MGIKRHGVGEKIIFEHNVRRSEEKAKRTPCGEEEK